MANSLWTRIHLCLTINFAPMYAWTIGSRPVPQHKAVSSQDASGRRSAVISCLKRLGSCRPAVLMMLAVGGLSVARVVPDVVADDFRAARRTLTRQIQAREEDECLLALEELRNYPVAEAARLVIMAIERHPSQTVQQAAEETLCVLAEHHQPADYLQKALIRELRGRNPSKAVLPMFLALGSAKQESATKLHEVLAEVYRPATPGAARVLTLIDALGERGGSRAVHAMAAAAGSGLFAQDFAFRRAVVQSLLRVRLAEALTILIGLLPRLDGEVRAEAVEYLARVTGEPASRTDAEWQAWWQANQSQFAFPTSEVLSTEPVAIGRRAAISYYYNLPIYARRVVFVIDTSSSMRGERMLAAQRELINALEGLDENVSFSIVAFDTQARAWQPQLVQATPQAKASAREFVARQQASGATASFDALEMAFAYDAEAIYFLTDGAPSAGKIPQPATIVEVVTRQNRVRRITINAIGIGVGPDGGPFEVFLRTLAEQNFGRFRRVDE